MFVAQINNTTGTVLYLHHDQQGSTRMLTGSTGKAEATMTYDAYGNTTGTTGTAKTPLGYNGQYTSSDTGLIYLRARAYDPKTAQFVSADPIAQITRAPYNYTSDNPVNAVDLSGLCGFSSLGDFGDCFEKTGTTLGKAGGAVAGAAGDVAQYVVDHRGQIAEFAAVGTLCLWQSGRMCMGHCNCICSEHSR